MAECSAEIAIIGAGPSGAHLATRLADAGRDVILFDPKGAWEKPCGGGVPTRAIKEFAFLLENSNYPRKIVDRITLISPVGRRVTLKVAEPFAIYSRKVLNGLVLDRAISAGARFVRAGVNDFSRGREGWNISTDDGGIWNARFLVGADGAASFTRRRLVGIFPKQDLALAFGYNVEEDHQGGIAKNVSRNGNGKHNPNAHGEEAVVSFPRDFTGYLWAFPRPGVMNFGVASKLGERTSDELRGLLSNFMRDYYGGRMPEAERVSFFGAKIPTLDLASWEGLQTSGEAWALVGDAAGFADPITGEGIYYAFKSADVLADALISERVEITSAARDCDSKTADSVERSGACSLAEYGRATASYDKLWRAAFGGELEHASYRLPQFYHSRFLGHIFTDAMIRLARHHRGVRTILVRALTGEQSYVTLKRDLLRCAYQVF